LRRNGRTTAVKARGAWRPDHGPKSFKARANHPAHEDFFAAFAGNIGAEWRGKRRNDGERCVMPVLPASYARSFRVLCLCSRSEALFSCSDAFS
jgi:hypothetical protein